jgi:hypothetical protein
MKSDDEVGLERAISSYPERDLVEEAVRATRGVKEIDDRLRVDGARRRPADLGVG